MLSTVQTFSPVDSQILPLNKGVFLPFPPNAISLFLNCNFQYNGLFLAMLLSMSSNMWKTFGHFLAIHLKLKFEGKEEIPMNVNIREPFLFGPRIAKF